MIQKLSKSVQSIQVGLRPYNISGLDTCVLQIVFEEVCLLTDIGAICMDISKMHINYGKNEGPHPNSWFITSKIFEAVGTATASYQFEVHILHVHGTEVRFKLKPVVSSPKLTIPVYFETSLASFDKLVGAVERKQRKDRKIAKIMQFRQRSLQAIAA